MALPIPSLDDRDFDQLYQEAVRLIPRHCPEWTDHNLSDPGIIMTELFAYLMDICMYQTDIISESNYKHFAELFGVLPKLGESAEDTLKNVIVKISKITKAVSTGDFEWLLLNEYNNSQNSAKNRIARVVTDISVQADMGEQYINIVIVPEDNSVYAPVPSNEMCETVFMWLKSRTPITTRFKVIAPEYADISLDIEIVKKRNSLISHSAITENIKKSIMKFLSPLTGGFDNKGWPFGKAVYRSELFKVIEDVDGVDHVKSLRLNGSETNSSIDIPSLVTISGVGVSAEANSGISVDVAYE